MRIVNQNSKLCDFSVIKTSIISSLNCDGFDGCELIMTIYNQRLKQRKKKERQFCIIFSPFIIIKIGKMC